MKSFDSILILTFLLFGFIGLVFEPLYYFGCNWSLSNCSLSSSSLVHLIGEIWSLYDIYDPIFLHIPLWLQVMCTIEVIIFGPLYVICAYGLAKKSKWLSSIALPFSGALFYSTIVYFAMEIIDPIPGTNLFVVFVVNIPWTIFPILLGYRVLQEDFQQYKRN